MQLFFSFCFLVFFFFFFLITQLLVDVLLYEYAGMLKSWLRKQETRRHGHIYFLWGAIRSLHFVFFPPQWELARVCVTRRSYIASRKRLPVNLCTRERIWSSVFKRENTRTRGVYICARATQGKKAREREPLVSSAVCKRHTSRLRVTLNREDK